jgi:hypothetical protein
MKSVAKQTVNENMQLLAFRVEVVYRVSWYHVLNGNLPEVEIHQSPLRFRYKHILLYSKSVVQLRTWGLESDWWTQAPRYAFILCTFSKNAYDIIYLKDTSYDCTHIQLVLHVSNTVTIFGLRKTVVEFFSLNSNSLCCCCWCCCYKDIMLSIARCLRCIWCSRSYESCLYSSLQRIGCSHTDRFFTYVLF